MRCRRCALIGIRVRGVSFESVEKKARQLAQHRARKSNHLQNRNLNTLLPLERNKLQLKPETVYRLKKNTIVMKKVFVGMKHWRPGELQIGSLDYGTKETTNPKVSNTVAVCQENCKITLAYLGRGDAFIIAPHFKESLIINTDIVSGRIDIDAVDGKSPMFDEDDEEKLVDYDAKCASLCIGFGIPNLLRTLDSWLKKEGSYQK
ncbi:unnamed protein product [Mytilus coruscus]|uniref:Uncharacterized protein n=1 Tax=Mytilus coruscus TaxID=42192 RepID=A0A6J8ENY9_MYTCO|nr:unnamed protein product [Mytilus coruscus]